VYNVNVFECKTRLVNMYGNEKQSDWNNRIVIHAIEL